MNCPQKLIKLSFTTTLLVFSSLFPNLATAEMKGIPISEALAKKKPSGKISGLFRNVREKIKEQGITKNNAIAMGAKNLSTSLVRVNSRASLHTYLYVNELSDDQKKQLENLGVEIEIVSKKLNMVQAWIPNDQMEAVSQISFIRRITPPSYGTPKVGSVTSKGDAILNAKPFRALGFDGSGVKIGVISTGADGLDDAVASGDLPPDIPIFGTCTHTTNCSELTAMLEIVHDLAPGTQLAGLQFETSLEFATDLNQLVDFGAQVIVNDLGFYTDPWFEEGIISQAIRDLESKGIIYVTAAGNDAQRHHQADFVQGSLPIVGTVHDFGLGIGENSDLTLNIVIQGFSKFRVFLGWADPYEASSNDYDLYILDESETVVIGMSATEQNGDDSPFEGLEVMNLGGQSAKAKVVVKKADGAEDRRIKLYFLGGGFLNEHIVSGGSILPSDAIPGTISVAAIGASGDDHDTAEPFSSQGPVEIFYPERETRDAPHLSGIDGVQVTGSGGFGSPFFGTSAAAPHVAALAGLLKGAFPEATRDDIILALQDSALDLGEPGFDYVFGAGRADVMAAARLLNSPPIASIDIPAGNIEIKKDELASFLGSCRDTDGDTAQTTFQWSFEEGSGVNVDTSSRDLGSAVSFPKSGTYTVTFTCTDQFGATSNPASIKVIVKGKSGCAIESSDFPSGMNPAFGLFLLAWLMIVRKTNLNT